MSFGGGDERLIEALFRPHPRGIEDVLVSESSEGVRGFYAALEAMCEDHDRALERAKLGASSLELLERNVDRHRGVVPGERRCERKPNQCSRYDMPPNVMRGDPATCAP